MASYGSRSAVCVCFFFFCSLFAVIKLKYQNNAIMKCETDVAFTQLKNHCRFGGEILIVYTLYFFCCAVLCRQNYKRIKPVLKWAILSVLISSALIFKLLCWKRKHQHNMHNAHIERSTAFRKTLFPFLLRIALCEIRVLVSSFSVSSFSPLSRLAQSLKMRLNETNLHSKSYVCKSSETCNKCGMKIM